MPTETPLPKARGNPSKKIFVSVLTKDLDLDDAIVELVDNSVDGARRSGSKDLSKFEIILTFSRDQFQIKDNCGGLDANLARDVALCFGRPDDRPPEKGLVGVFGVGLKRAIFKLGNDFEIESNTRTTRFVVADSYHDWVQRKSTWDFEFTEFDTATKNSADQVHTRITVSDLHDPIKAELATQLFTRDLIEKIADSQSDQISKGLRITVNTLPVTNTPLTLKSSRHIKPSFESFVVRVPRTEVDVNARIYAGVTDSNPNAAGWYVFCNGRMILRADQSKKTGWGETGDVSIPKIHNQFARFRGYVFLSCEDQEFLPWTTSKNGLDVESAVYKKVRPHIVESTRPVINYLNELDKEKDLDDKPLHDALEEAPDVVIAEVKEKAAFSYNRSNARPENRLVSISFKRPAKTIEKVKEKLAVRTNKEVGEGVFAYYCKYEKIKNE